MKHKYANGKGTPFAITIYKSRYLSSFRKLGVVTLLICLFSFHFVCFAQESRESGATEVGEIKPLQIGDTIPEELWNMPLQVVNHPDGKEVITLNDYRDKKLIILDFWATYCSPCIKSLVVLDSIQKLFQQDMAVLPVLVYSRTENSLQLMKKKEWTWPSVINDTLWNKTVLSRYLTGFGNAWIMNGKLMAVPRPDNLTYENIYSALYDRFPDLQNLEEIKVSKMVNTFKDTITTISSKVHTLEEVVVSTGYYQIPKERSTGSFSHIDEKLINRTAGNSILERLEGIVEGVQFNRQHVSKESQKTPSIRVRGLATIESDETPLIVLDNFPYEGNIDAIDPNDVENVTILKDAAAASIWGARAGNGVIVITTKKGRYNQKTKIGLNVNHTFSAKPDLYYSPNFLPASVVLDIEEERFSRGGYAEDPLTVLPDFVESLILHREGKLEKKQIENIKAKLSTYDIRDDASKYLYQNSLNQQYALNISGGSERHRYMFSGSYGKSRESIVGNNNNRLSLNMENGANILPNLELTAGIRYNNQKFNNNGLSLQEVNPSGQLISTYQTLMDEDGSYSTIPYRLRSAYINNTGRTDLLDWNYVPLNEQHLRDNKSTLNELLLRSQLNYRFLDGFNAQLSYQYIMRTRNGQNYHSPESYYSRDMINKFTQSNGSRIIPEGGIMQGSNPVNTVTHSGRFLLSYNKTLGGKHEINALGGSEIRDQSLSTSLGYVLYGYDSDIMTGTTYFDHTASYPILPMGNMQIPLGGSALQTITDRYLSHFANTAYTYLNRYTLSTSVRWDGSNLLGVKINQKGIPLWSIGGSWILSHESFYNSDIAPYQRLRFTYGLSGNVNKYVSTYPTISYGTSQEIPIARVTNIGNPGLRWEQVKTINVGWDFGFSKNRITGALEYYRKKSEDLIGVDYMPPSSGIIGTAGSFQNKINYANMSTNGVDFRLTAQLLNGSFDWKSTALVSYVRNKITHFNTNENIMLTEYFNIVAPPLVNRSRDVIYAIPWYGLNSEDGKPIIGEGEMESVNYKQYMDGLTTEDLVNVGVTVAPYYGSLRNTMRFKNLELNALLIWKAGFQVRRSSIAPGEEYLSTLSYHKDILNRWEVSGDELITNVPAAGDFDTYLSRFYNYSEVLVSKGDFIRLQDINFAYDFGDRFKNRYHIQNLRIFLNCTHLGILWRSNDKGIDPDFPLANYPQMRSVALGLQLIIQ